MTDRAVAYLRVSDPSQVEGHSLDAQERLFREVCKNRDWGIVRIYRDEGYSAHSDAIAKRPAFRQLLDDATRRQFEVVVVHTLDRWARNQFVLAQSLLILEKHGVRLVSITENFDRSNPEGQLTGSILGIMAEFSSKTLGKHISKALDQRAHEGKHTGGIPFGYESCWDIDRNGRRARCTPEHTGGVHLVEGEAAAVRELYRRYAAGITTLARLAAWLNAEGFRTRNTKKLPGPDGHLAAGPKLFTTASVRGILHNPFYAGQVSYKGKLLPGCHEPLVGRELFDLVQDVLRRNSGRSETLQAQPEREYLLKGIIRCAYCGMPMWAQTYKNGQRYYREHKGSRSHDICEGAGGSMPCRVADEQIGRVVEAIELGPKWLEEVLAIIVAKDEVARVKEERAKVQEKLRRMAKVYSDGLFDDDEYHRQKRLLEMELESLVVPQANAAEDAGKLVQDLPRLWAGANLTERRKLLLTMLDAVYVDAKDEKRIVAIKPKPPFWPVFQVATTREGSGVELIADGPPENSPEARRCFWWRRGRVRLGLKHGALLCTLADARICDTSPARSVSGLPAKVSPANVAPGGHHLPSTVICVQY